MRRATTAAGGGGVSICSHFVVCIICMRCAVPMMCNATRLTNSVMCIIYGVHCVKLTAPSSSEDSVSCSCGWRWSHRYTRAWRARRFRCLNRGMTRTAACFYAGLCFADMSLSFSNSLPRVTQKRCVLVQPCKLQRHAEGKCVCVCLCRGTDISPLFPAAGVCSSEMFSSGVLFGLGAACKI